MHVYAVFAHKYCSATKHVFADLEQCVLRCSVVSLQVYDMAVQRMLLYMRTNRMTRVTVHRPPGTEAVALQISRSDVIQMKMCTACGTAAPPLYQLSI